MSGIILGMKDFATKTFAAQNSNDNKNIKQNNVNLTFTVNNYSFVSRLLQTENNV